MEVDQIRTADDVERYIDGCLNDFEEGISEKEEDMKLIQRIIVSPLMLLLLLLYHLFHAVERWVSYLRYGGEIITYDKDSRKMIQDVYELVLTQIRRNGNEESKESCQI